MLSRLDITFIRKMQIRIPMRYHFTATRMAIIKKMDT